MRGHGVSRFPDPTTQGQLTVEMVQAQGIDLHSPAVLQAVQACLPASHGLLTPAKVSAALNKAGGAAESAPRRPFRPPVVAAARDLALSTHCRCKICVGESSR